MTRGDRRDRASGRYGNACARLSAREAAKVGAQSLRTQGPSARQDCRIEDVRLRDALPMTGIDGIMTVVLFGALWAGILTSGIALLRWISATQGMNEFDEGL